MTVTTSISPGHWWFSAALGTKPLWAQLNPLHLIHPIEQSSSIEWTLTRRAMVKPFECTAAPPTALCLTVLVKGMSSGPACCWESDFNSQLQSVVNVSADSNVVSFNVWNGIVGAQPNGIRAWALDGGSCVWLHLKGARNRELLECIQDSCISRTSRMQIWFPQKGRRKAQRWNQEQLHTEEPAGKRRGWGNGRGFWTSKLWWGSVSRSDVSRTLTLSFTKDMPSKPQFSDLENGDRHT